MRPLVGWKVGVWFTYRLQCFETFLPVLILGNERSLSNDDWQIKQPVASWRRYVDIYFFFWPPNSCCSPFPHWCWWLSLADRINKVFCIISQLSGVCYSGTLWHDNHRSSVTTLGSSFKQYSNSLWPYTLYFQVFFSPPTQTRRLCCERVHSSQSWAI